MNSHSSAVQWSLYLHCQLVPGLETLAHLSKMALHVFLGLHRCRCCLFHFLGEGARDLDPHGPIRLGRVGVMGKEQVLTGFLLYQKSKQVSLTILSTGIVGDIPEPARLGNRGV